MTAGGRTVAFVTGVARSGTTVLTDLLNAHPEVCIGIERYKFRFLRDHVAGGDYFERERFFRFLPEDTNVLPRAGNRWERLYRAMEHKFERARVVGDKVRMAPAIRLLLDTWPGARVIYIVRSVDRVAASWEARRRNPRDVNWAQSRDGDAAVETWNEENRRTLRLARELGPRLLVVSYERLFAGTSDLARLTAFLGVADAPELAACHAELSRQYEQEIRDKPLAVAKRELAALRRKSDRASYRRLLALAEAAAPASA